MIERHKELKKNSTILSKIEKKEAFEKIRRCFKSTHDFFWKSNLHINAFVFAVLPIFLLLIVELFNKQNIIQTFYWIITSPVAFVLNYLLILSVFFLFLLLLGRVHIAATVSIVIMTFLSLVSAHKKLLLGEPLLPWDFSMFRQAANLLPNIYNGIGSLNLFIIALALILIAMGFITTKKFFIGFKYRLVLGLLAALILGGLSVSPRMIYVTLPKIGISNMEWMQSDNYEQNGMTLAFMMNVKNIVITKPDGYTEKTVESTVETVKSLKSEPNKEFKQPNVIMVMSEAFWDPTLLKSVSFTVDPIPNMHSLMKKYTSGYLLSPAYGGGTSNVEFEVLTGNSMSFFPDGANPYQQYINKPLPSLASIFAEHGYKSIAVHTYNKWFFNRDKVYNLMGFQKFIGLEDFKNPKYKGLYISDEEFTNMIIREHKNSDKPVFMYSISMQNHGPYEPRRYTNTAIKVKSDNLSEQSKSILEEYAQGIHDADASLKRLTDYFEKVKEPTVIVFFGDHLPMLGNDFSTYKESGFVKTQSGSWTPEEYRDLHATPLLIWTNYIAEEKDLGTLGSAYYLGSYIMDYINMDKPLYYDFLDDERDHLPGNLKYLKMDSNKALYAKIPPELKKYENTQWLLQYDMMFGKRYAKNQLFGSKSLVTNPTQSNVFEQKPQ